MKTFFFSDNLYNADKNTKKYILVPQQVYPAEHTAIYNVKEDLT